MSYYLENEKYFVTYVDKFTQAMTNTLVPSRNDLARLLLLLSDEKFKDRIVMGSIQVINNFANFDDIITDLINQGNQDNMNFGQNGTQKEV